MCLILSFISCQKDTDSNPNKDSDGQAPTVTEKGTSIGTATTAQIDSNGGTLTTSDGKLTITIPANALNSNTTISAEPITNNAPGGVGTAYRLGPEGQQFAKPITLTFKYKDEDFDGSTPDLGWIVVQNNDNTWSGHPKTNIDSNNKTLSVESTHFSDWGYGKVVEMSLNKTNVVVQAGGEPVQFILQGYTTQAEINRKIKDAAANDDIPLPRLKLPKIGKGIEFQEIDLNSSNVFWQLNGKKTPVYDDKIGNLIATNDTGQISANYTPPKKAPTPNTVGLSLNIANYILTANITILELGISLNVDGEIFTYRNGDGGLDASRLLGNSIIISGSDTDRKTSFSLNMFDPKLGDNKAKVFIRMEGGNNGEQQINFSRKEETVPYNYSDYQCNPNTSDGGPQCKCTSQTDFPDWDLTITSFPKKEDRTGCFDGKPKKETLVKGTFKGKLGKSEKNGNCTTIKPVNFSGSFAFMYSCD